MKLPALKAGLPGKEDKHFCIAPLDPALKDGACGEQAGQTFEEYIQNPKVKVVILRHDVDRLPGNSLKTALLENELGIRATYFFRTIPQTFKPKIIKEIAEMGHEIGYHYEDVDLSSRGQRSEAGLKIEDEKVRRLEEQMAEDGGQKWKQQDGWMNRMIHAGRDGKEKTEDRCQRSGSKKIRRLEIKKIRKT